MKRIFNEDINIEKQKFLSKLWLENYSEEYYNYIFRYIQTSYVPESKKDLIPVKPRVYPIKDAIPIMISDIGEIVCIPKLKDPIRAVWTGASGCGKTLSMLHYLSCVHKYYNDPIFVVNDSQNLSKDWNKPQDNNDFIRLLWLIGEFPTPLPIVQLYPVSNNFKEPSDRVDYLKICLDWEEVSSKLDEYVDLQKSRKHYIRIRERLASEKSIDNIMSIIKEELQGPKETKVMIINLIYELFKDNIINLSTTEETVSLIKVKSEIDRVERYEYQFPVILGLMYAGVIPVLMTENIAPKWFDIYFNTKLKEVYNNQTRDGPFKKNNKIVHLFLDELQMFYKKEYSKVKETIETMAEQGRNRRICLYYATQNLNKIDEALTSNTDYGMIMQCKDQKDISVIKKMFNLGKRYDNIIRELNKERMECLACTNIKFLIFNPYDNRQYYSSEPIRGIYLPPLCHTKPPIT